MCLAALNKLAIGYEGILVKIKHELKKKNNNQNVLTFFLMTKEPNDVTWQHVLIRVVCTARGKGERNVPSVPAW